MHSVQPTISSVHYSGKQVIGTSEYMYATLIVTTSISEDLISTIRIVEVMDGGIITTATMLDVTITTVLPVIETIM